MKSNYSNINIFSENKIYGKTRFLYVFDEIKQCIM